ncbi:hypothetical protein HUF18_04090 [Thalassolituus sp. ST750PaO-4]|uniref:DUF5666 domain-containing protein n=1 Tax=Thalassolituus sp. ST750PaO-4 TaxID=2742965 RepID=UPI000C544754|nr:DUF5666 domain-containing protein [Thalassolituus sp. ST750PaO-4]MCA6058944.1 hypothetical protein [Thalassolituus sp. ST750PaO-4]PIQ39956.1 MAG: hypothetical protein COW58_08835 [Thalassolituus sp. CG17_big_fil_post_rev_8_21_14_2_50_53_8]
MKKHLLSVAVCLAGTLLVTACGGSSSSAKENGKQVTRGVIDGFGSVIVNGVHFNSDRTQFTVDDRAGIQADLRVGQVVTIVGNHNGAEGVAAEIIYDVSVEGTVTAIDSASGTLTVLGQTVVTDAMTIFEGLDLATLTVGQRVEVSGYSAGEGRIIASFIAADDADQSPEELTGVVAGFDSSAQTFLIGSQLISYASVATLDLDGATLSDGMQVEVEGTLDGDVLVASEIEAEDSDFEEDTELEMSGAVTAVDADNNQFVLNGMTVRFDSETEFDDGDQSALQAGVMVEVEGVVGTDGVLLAEEIEFEEAPEIELEGVVQATTENTLTVMGITINADLRTRVRDERDDEVYFNLSMLQPGDHVELLLEETTAGQYRAQLLERVDASNKVELKAPVSAIDLSAGTVVLLGLTLDVSAQDPSMLSSLVSGSMVEIEGSFDGQVLIVQSMEIDD